MTSGKISKSEVAICTYRIRKGHEAAFLRTLARHWPTLKRQRLVVGKPAMIYRGLDSSKKAFFVEIFTWASGGPETAHRDPAVMQVWESMGTHMEARAGRPAMEHPHVQPVSIRFAKV